MARSHSGGRVGGITELRSRFPEIMAELPIRTFEVAMEVAKATATGATERANSQGYEGSFNIEAREVSGQEGEVRGGEARSGKYITGWTLSSGHTGGPFVIHDRAAGVYADWYWFFGEFGTARQPARPFMIPAYEVARATVPAAGKVALSNL